ncbi:hypothetical protein LTR28_013977, partial [Elasticomyces elasticus]
MAARYHADEDGDNSNDNNPLAYGEYHSHPDEGQTERGLFSDVYRRPRGRHPASTSSPRPDVFPSPCQASPPLPLTPPPPRTPPPIHTDTARLKSGAETDQYQGHGSPLYQQPPPAAPPASVMSFLFDKMHSAVHGIGAELKEKISGQGETHGHTHMSGQCSDGTHSQRLHRFQSFAPEREGNDVK